MARFYGILLPIFTAHVKHYVRVFCYYCYCFSSSPSHWCYRIIACGKGFLPLHVQLLNEEEVHGLFWHLFHLNQLVNREWVSSSSLLLGKTPPWVPLFLTCRLPLLAGLSIWETNCVQWGEEQWNEKSLTETGLKPLGLDNLSPVEIGVSR